MVRATNTPKRAAASVRPAADNGMVVVPQAAQRRPASRRHSMIGEGDSSANTPADGEDKARKITREDLAAFLVARLTDDEHLHGAVTTANS